MRKNQWILMGLFILIAGCVTGRAEPGKNLDKPGWHLVWQDEFNGNAMDPAKWRAEDAALVKNNELQYYSPDEVYVHDGLLTLRSREREKGGRDYTSGLVETKGRFSQKFGRIEIRARLPKGQGIWPAHWMLPISAKWPPEIDIMELIGHSPRTVFMTVHWGQWPAVQHYGKMYTGPDFSAGFHTFAVEWDPDRLRWYVDGVLRCTTSGHIPQERFYIILNTAVGGNWPGAPNSTTVFPQYHDIDYVRVYGREVPGTYFLTAAAAHGSVDTEPDADRYPANSTVTLTARPGIGYEFNHWSGGARGNQNPLTVKMNRHKAVTANFKPSAHPPVLLSAGGSAAASSAESEAFSAANAVDGNTQTRWSSDFSDPQWIQLDLGEICSIEAVRLRWEIAFARAYELQVSDDAREWKTIYSTDNGSGDIEEITGLHEQGRYVRMYGTARNREFGYSLWEFEVYGTSPEPAAALPR